MKALDFKFLLGDGILEARIDNGYYHIVSDFTVTAFFDEKCLKIGEYSDIYEALDAANKHYNTAPNYRQTIR